MLLGGASGSLTDRLIRPPGFGQGSRRRLHPGLSVPGDLQRRRHLRGQRDGAVHPASTLLGIGLDGKRDSAPKVEDDGPDPLAEDEAAWQEHRCRPAAFRCPTDSWGSWWTPPSRSCSGLSRTFAGRGRREQGGVRGGRPRRRQVGPAERRRLARKSSGRTSTARRSRRCSCSTSASCFDDDDIVVVDKPAGVAAHPSLGWDGPTVLGALAGRGSAIATSRRRWSGPGSCTGSTSARAASMVVAKSERAYGALKRAFHDREVDKASITPWCQGHPDPAGRHDRCADRTPPGLELEVRGRRRRQGLGDPLRDPRGVPLRRACSRWSSETRRTHQIRVHMAAQRHPASATRCTAPDPAAERLGLTRQWLQRRAVSASSTRAPANRSSSSRVTPPTCNTRWTCAPGGLSRRLGWEHRGPERLLRAPARAHRLLDARRCREVRPLLESGRRARGCRRRRDHRSRQHVRRLRLLEDGHRARHQADHRHRGVHHPGHPSHATRPGCAGATRIQQSDDVGGSGAYTHMTMLAAEQRGHAQPVPAVFEGVDRGLLLQAADGPRAARAVLQGHHRDHRLRRRRGADAPAARSVRRGTQGGRRVPGHLRQGELLRRDRRPRHRHRAAHDRRPAQARQGARDAVGRDQRPPLRARRRRAVAGSAALRRHRLDDGRPESLQARRRGVLPASPPPRCAGSSATTPRPRTTPC